MRKLKILVIVLLCSVTSFSQQTKKKIRPHRVWVSVIEDQDVIKGYLFAIDDTSIKIINKKSLDTSDLKTVEAKNIDIIKIRRKGKIGRGIGIGAASGIVLGVIVGLVDSQDSWISTETSVAMASAPLTLIGAGLGAGFGAIKKKIEVKGNIEVFKNEMNWLNDRSREPK